MYFIKNSKKNGKVILYNKESRGTSSLNSASSWRRVEAVERVDFKYVQFE